MLENTNSCHAQSRTATQVSRKSAAKSIKDGQRPSLMLMHALKIKKNSTTSRKYLKGESSKSATTS
jgi:hypothetical protein